MDNEYKLSLPSNSWVDAQVLENSLRNAGNAFAQKFTKVIFHFGINCKIMVDAGVRLLSLANQLNSFGKAVILEFEDDVFGECEGKDYLNRIGFFYHLSDGISVHNRPNGSLVHKYKGTNIGTVEIEGICPNCHNKGLPSKLANSLEAAYEGRNDLDKLSLATFTVFAELIGNVFEHSSTKLKGFAAFQKYSKGKKAKVVVSDSGLGILETLKPTLDSEKLKRLGDADLIVEIFRQGLSSKGSERGCGLKVCAEHAIKYRASLDIRLATCRVLLVPAENFYEANKAFCQPDLPFIKGTHICFNFFLD